MSDSNEKMIAEFRGNGGHTEQFGDALLVLHSLGARSGKTRLNPMAFQASGEDWAVFASAAGADRHPAWFHNLVAHPDVEIEVGDGESVHTVPVRAQAPSAARSGRSRSDLCRGSRSTRPRPTGRSRSSCSPDAERSRRSGFPAPCGALLP